MNLAAWNETVDAIYAAASSPGNWPDTLQQIAHLLDSRGGLLLYRHDDGRFGMIVAPTLVEMAREYGRYWHRHDVRADRVFEGIASGYRDVHSDYMHFTDEEMASLPIYQQFLLPNGIRWGMSAPVSPTPAVSVILTALREKEKPPFGDEAHELMLQLSRHVERALSLSIRLMDAEAEKLGFSEALDRIDCAAFVLDYDRRVLFANDMALRMMGGGIYISSGQFEVRDRTARQGLLERLAAAHDDAQRSTAACASLIVPNGERGLILQVVPLRSSGDLPALRSASAIVLATDQQQGRPFDPAVVRDAFKLTMGEARLTTLVGSGIPPGEAAERLGITENTARSVLRRSFDKMGVSRQSEMAALMGRLFMLRQNWQQPSDSD
ncbi:helix-turn-helix transcriptional regulator [Methylobacterium durans]|uniref:helix-turn-helix transcriptional regulator n=1 Tax=Methylobacterium durans TaxID=2202825 RepID=UPI002AFF8934|nr:helix-turn-helix transcriptional regulator [Methylobacterium durans]MEA1831268.1 helix-turn-helix transcriptional regulator [Methylobacterium durans]